MQLINQLLDYSKRWELPDAYLFTGNPVRKTNGAIVMGRGAAKQCRDTYPGIDLIFGKLLEEQPTAHLLWTSINEDELYGADQYLGWFKVKHHWQNMADIRLIQESVKQLSQLALTHQDMTFHMNYPGIGNGGLSENLIDPVIQQFPDNVWIYR